MVWLNVIARLKPHVSPRAPRPRLTRSIARIIRRPEGRPRDAMELTPLRRGRWAASNDASVYTFVDLLGGGRRAHAAHRLRQPGEPAAVAGGRAAARDRGPDGDRRRSRRIARQLLIESLRAGGPRRRSGLYVADAGAPADRRDSSCRAASRSTGLDLGLNRTALLFTAAGRLRHRRAVRPGARVARVADGRPRVDSRGIARDHRAQRPAIDARRRAGRAQPRAARRDRAVPAEPRRTRCRCRSASASTGVATATVNLGVARYDMPRARVFYDEVLARVQQLPGVTAAAWTTILPLNGACMIDATSTGYQPQRATKTSTSTSRRRPRVLRGRRHARCCADARSTTATRPRRRVSASSTRPPRASTGPAATRCRVASRSDDQLDADRRRRRRREDRGAGRGAEAVRLPALLEQPGGTVRSRRIWSCARRATCRAQLGAARVRFEPSIRPLPSTNVNTFAWHVRELVMPQRMGATLFGVFGALALTLAAIGIYGVASYVAALRTREIGIRIALGADRARIRASCCARARVPIAAGIVAGLIVAALGSRLASAFLRGVTRARSGHLRSGRGAAHARSPWSRRGFPRGGPRDSIRSARCAIE